MTIKQACYRLSLARKKATGAKEEITRLNKIIERLGGDPEEKKRRRRNREIFRQYKKGYSFSSIASEVRLTPARVRQICIKIERTEKLKS